MLYEHPYRYVFSTMRCGQLPFGHFYTGDDQFTKTGSGQTSEKSSKKCVVRQVGARRARLNFLRLYRGPRRDGAHRY